MAGLAVGVAALVAVVTTTGAFSRSVSKELDSYGFNIVAYPATANLSVSYGGMTVSGTGVSQFKAMKKADVEKIKALPEAKLIGAVSPKALRSADIDGKKALVIGVDFGAERAVKKWWRVGGSMPKAEDQVIVGYTAARLLGLKTGERFVLGDSTAKVSGILEDTGSQDDGVIFADLDTVWRTLGRPSEVDVVEITAKDSKDVDRIVAAVSKAVPDATVSSVKKAVEYKQTTMDTLGRFGIGVTALVIIVSGFVVFATMMGSVRDRTTEIGVFRAVGFRRTHVSQIIRYEAVLLSLAAGVIGSIAGLFLAFGLPKAVGIEGIVVEPDILAMVGGILSAVAVGTVATILPARKAADMDPAEALKTI